jgi:hypothetical protein
LQVARAAYVAALDRWLDDPHRADPESDVALELAAAGRLLRRVLRAAGVDGDLRMPERPFG